MRNEALENENRFLHNVIKTMQRAFDVAEIPERIEPYLNRMRISDLSSTVGVFNLSDMTGSHADNRQNRHDYERTEN